MEAQNAPDFEVAEAHKPGTKVRALYNFRARAADELPFTENQTIAINVAMSNSEWWHGETGGKKGWFPSSYVEVLTATSARTWTKHVPEKNSLSAGEKLQALMDMNFRSATLPARFRRSPVAAQEAAAGSTGGTGSTPSPPKVDKPSPTPLLPTIATDKSVKRLSSKSSLATGNRRKSAGSPPVITGGPGTAVEMERWKDKVSKEVYDSISEKERQRQEVIFELLRTEQEYIRDLGVVIDVPISHFPPLVAPPVSWFLSFRYF